MTWLLIGLLISVLVAGPLAWYYNQLEYYWGRWHRRSKRMFKNTTNFPIPTEYHPVLRIDPAKFAEICGDVESIKSKFGEMSHPASQFGNPDRVVLRDSLMHVQCQPVDLQLTEEQVNRISASLRDGNDKIRSLLEQATKIGGSSDFAMRALSDPKTGKMEMVSFDVISHH
jgi:hypothetical protein